MPSFVLLRLLPEAFLFPILGIVPNDCSKPNSRILLARKTESLERNWLELGGSWIYCCSTLELCAYMLDLPVFNGNNNSVDGLCSWPQSEM